MKFRNPETGEVFEEIWPLLNLYCISHSCENCSLPLNCARYCIDFPEEAARLMGFEVVEETIKTVPGHEPLTTAQQKDMAEFIDSNVILFPSLAKKEEANMDKPRICEVLGVEVREEFDFCMFSGLYVDEAGYVRLNEGAIIESTILCLLINEPDSIIRKPRFTQQEVERAKNLLEVVGNGELKQVGDMTTLRVDGKIIYLRKGAFPSMKPEQAITLDEIIGGAQ